MKAIIRKDDQAVSPVIATILMVAITVVLAAVLYVMVSGLIGGTTTQSKPQITFTVSKITGGVDILVAGAQPASTYTNFKVNFQVATSFGVAIALPASGVSSTAIAVGSNSFNVTWQNPGGSGNVVGGDHFIVKYVGTAPSSGTSVSLLLIWAGDSSTIATATWQV